MTKHHESTLAGFYGVAACTNVLVVFPVAHQHSQTCQTRLVAEGSYLGKNGVASVVVVDIDIFRIVRLADGNHDVKDGEQQNNNNADSCYV